MDCKESDKKQGVQTKQFWIRMILLLKMVSRLILKIHFGQDLTGALCLGKKSKSIY